MTWENQKNHPRKQRWSSINGFGKEVARVGWWQSLSIVWNIFEPGRIIGHRHGYKAHVHRKKLNE